MSVAILSLPFGTNFSQYIPEYKENNNHAAVNFALDIGSNDDLRSGKPLRIMHVDSNLNLEAMGSSTNSINSPQIGKLCNIYFERFNPHFTVCYHYF